MGVLQPKYAYSAMKSRPNSNRRKRSPMRNGGNNTAAVVYNQPAKSLVMGQVKILKRGDLLNELKSPIDGKEKPKPQVEEIDDSALSMTDRFGLEPDLVSKKIKVADFYAGSGFFNSPPPSSLPLPAFFSKKSGLTNRDPTAELRRILGLDLQ